MRIDDRDERVHGRFLGAAEHLIKVIGLNRSAVMRLCPTPWCDAADDDPEAAFFSDGLDCGTME